MRHGDETYSNYTATHRQDKHVKASELTWMFWNTSRLSAVPSNFTIAGSSPCTTTPVSAEFAKYTATPADTTHTDPRDLWHNSQELLKSGEFAKMLIPDSVYILHYPGRNERYKVLSKFRECQTTYKNRAGTGDICSLVWMHRCTFPHWGRTDS